MARLKVGDAPKRVPSLRGVVSLRSWAGNIYAQAWPRSRGAPKQIYQRAGLERMKVAQKAVKYLPADERLTMEEGLRKWLQTHTGVRGTAAIRLRDWLTQVIYGRAWMLILPNGKRVYSAAMQRDASDFLDWVEPRLGSLMTRTGEGWLCTVQCKPGAVLCSIPSGFWAGACPPASIPDRTQAMGGT